MLSHVDTDHGGTYLRGTAKAEGEQDEVNRQPDNVRFWLKADLLLFERPAGLFYIGARSALVS